MNNKFNFSLGSRERSMSPRLWSFLLCALLFTSVSFLFGFQSFRSDSVALEDISPPSIPSPTPSYSLEKGVSQDEFLALQPHLFPIALQSKGVGCLITETTKFKDTYDYKKPLSKGCPNYEDMARLVRGKNGQQEVEVLCSTRPTYTYDPQDLYNPLDFPMNQTAPRRFFNAPLWKPRTNVTVHLNQTLRIAWPPNESYVEVHCGSIIKYFARFIEKAEVRERLRENEMSANRGGRQPTRPNILVMVVDSVALAQSHFLFPETTAFLKTINSGSTHRLFSFNRFNPNNPRHTITALTAVFAGVHCALFPLRHSLFFILSFLIYIYI